ncbi:DDE superfamily endonuclease [Aliiruegeria haliotis]|uniref:DDE superfamily endonuclease n=1 Tax=Aliiruegeria haliotis TaxID=1280846 RepID=A0A2T0RM65_9RHOB|nr:DDE superfamily endonuclease [Aliiruegeria haliotis]
MRSSHWRWHLDEIFVRINGERHYLWRAVVHEGEVLESYVTMSRDTEAALKFPIKMLRRYARSETTATDWLRSCGAALKEIGAPALQESGRWLNKRAENRHLAFRRGERAMQRLRRMRRLQLFAAVCVSVFNHFNSERSFYS